MKRDLVYYYERPTAAVFDAFVRAANEKFGKNCKIEQGKTINFALNFSFKYNMNGGAVTAHFMPYQNGTAVDLRYTIVQLVGARYKAHARDLTLYVDALLQTSGMLIQLDINQFLVYENNTPAGEIYVQQTPPRQPQVAPYAPQALCQNCGNPMSPDAQFCAVCGQPVQKAQPPQPEQQAVCQGCGNPLSPDARFCPVCGQAVQQAEPQQPEQPQEVVCPNCSAKLDGTGSFCPVCGTKLN